MKLVINIPCYNEETTLPLVLEEIPKKIPGISKIEVQIVDDGSADRTAEVAARYGCRVLRHKKNSGLGVAFRTGMEAALEHGADIMVNTDADNQYPSKYIAELVQPVIRGEADVVIGNRQTWKVAHFSPVKKFFQWFGSAMVRRFTQSDVVDTVSGFRAYSKRSMLKLNVTTKFSYVLDTIMQSARKDLKMVSVDITTNEPTRESRLFKNMFQHMWKSGVSLLNVYVLYQPFQTFLYLTFVFILPALALIVRYLYFFAIGDGKGHIHSLIAAAILAVIGGLMFVVGIIGDLIKKNRELIEESLYLMKRERYGEEMPPKPKGAAVKVKKKKSSRKKV